MQKRNMAFIGEVATKGGVERFLKDFLYLGGRQTKPRFLLLDGCIHHLNDLKCFGRAYKMGFQSDEHIKTDKIEIIKKKVISFMLKF